MWCNQYTHDQTIRHMNKGLTPDELVEVVKLPNTLPTTLLVSTTELLHTLFAKFTWRQRFLRRSGWQLEPMAYEQRAKAFVEIMGGRDNIIDTAKAAIKAENYTFAAEILSTQSR